MYSLQKIGAFGARISGISLSDSVSPETVARITADLHQHRLLIFTGQGVVSGQRQVEISRWFGQLCSSHYRHPSSPHSDVFRVSNDDDEGCTGVGRTGWHIDGTFLNRPYKVQIMHIVACPSKGDTAFIASKEFIQSLPQSTLERLNRLWFVGLPPNCAVHPLFYAHPTTGLPTMLVHLGMCGGFIEDFGRETQRHLAKHESEAILDELSEIFEATRGTPVRYQHRWQPGDLIVNDNLALLHEATPDTQLPREEVGLRIMHRTTVEGVARPAKRSATLHQQEEGRAGVPAVSANGYFPAGQRQTVHEAVEKN